MVSNKRQHSKFSPSATNPNVRETLLSKIKYLQFTILRNLTKLADELTSTQHKRVVLRQEKALNNKFAESSNQQDTIIEVEDLCLVMSSLNGQMSDEELREMLTIINDQNDSNSEAVGFEGNKCIQQPFSSHDFHC